MQIIQPDSTKIATLTRGYAKIRSTDPKLQHPTDPTLLRQITPVEHARIKGVPEKMIEGLGITIAHQMLGQSILAKPFRRSDEQTSELQSLMRLSYAVFCLKKKKK